MPLLGAIEAGGTKFFCAVGKEPGEILARTLIPTTTPEKTLGAVLDFFEKAAAEHGPIGSVGIASFGPIDCDPQSSSYGYIAVTSKPGWSVTDMVGPVADRLKVPVSFDTDVNGATLGEARWGAGQGLSDLVYITVGTGVGGGALVNGQLVRGLIHTEMGHMNVLRSPDDDFDGICPFHGDCLEGLASGPANEARWGRRGEDLPPDHPAWKLQSYYVAQMCMNLTAVLSPQRIILGGGVMHQNELIDRVREDFVSLLNKYLPTLAKAGGIERYIVLPDLGDESALYGAFTAAQDAMAG